MRYKPKRYVASIVLILLLAAICCFAFMLEADSRTRKLGTGDDTPSFAVRWEEGSPTLFLFGRKYTVS